MRSKILRPLWGLLIAIGVGIALAVGTGHLGVGIGVAAGLAIIFCGATLLRSSQPA